MAERKLKQIKICPDHYEYLKSLAKARKKTLQDLAEKAVIEFVTQRNNDDSIYIAYLNSPFNAKYKSFWFDQAILNKVKTVAQRDSTSENRVIYTSILHYCAEQQKTAPLA